MTRQFWTRAALCCGLCAALLCGCGAAPSRSTVDPQDPLTGEQPAAPGQRVAAVAVSNDPEAGPQRGLSTASVVLEALTVQNTPTRLCLVYPAAEQVPQVGPVADGQDLYWQLLAGQQVLAVQRGGSRYTRNYFDYYNLEPIDGAEVGRLAFHTSQKWSNAPAWYTSGPELEAAAARLGLTTGIAVGKTTATDTEGRLQLPALLPFAENGRLPAPSQEGAAAMQVQFGPGSATGFRYDEASQQYRMERGNGVPQRDANTGVQAAFDNLLVLYTASSLREDGRTLEYDLSMGGGLLLRAGRLWHITWRQGAQSTLALYDEDGKALALAPGSSYIALVSSVTGREVSVTDGSGQSLL